MNNLNQIIFVTKTEIGNFEIVFTLPNIINSIRPTNKEKTIAFSKVQKNIGDELKNFFSGKIKNFTFKCKPNGTIFQLKVWNNIKKISYGTTKTYKELAKTLDTSARAIGNACSKNPCLFIIPCHRVILSNGNNGNYILGKKVKIKLIKKEKF